ncbi:ABC transporter ATP-binding protein, partial [Acidobacteriota bacterium]
EGDWVLKGATFRVEKGESVAMVGPTGAGKTTLISLLTRFYEPQRGTILVNGKEIREYSVPSLRQAIGVVLQDVFLFSGSVRDNITLGKSGMGEVAIEQSARMANAIGFIDKLPERYETDIRERGGLLSTGQKQLLAFARILAYDPRIIIMDEATSSVDSLTESLIKEAIARLLTGRTAIVIAHRLSTVRNADRILVLTKGVIREQGTHQELMDMGGVYRRLYEYQFQSESVTSTAT